MIFLLIFFDYRTPCVLPLVVILQRIKKTTHKNRYNFPTKLKIIAPLWQRNNRA